MLSRSLYIPRRLDLVKNRFAWSFFPELSGKGVTSITQDSLGMIWFGSEAGIFRYDGMDWKLYNKDHGLPEGAAWMLKCGPDGRLYAVFENSGVFTLTDTLWQPLFVLRDDSAVVYHDVLPLQKDSLWVATNRGAFLLRQNSLSLVTADEITQVVAETPATTAPVTDVYQIFEDRSAALWFLPTTGDEGIVFIPRWRANLTTPQQWRRLFPKPGSRPLGLRPKIYQASDGSFWIYSYSEEVGLYHFSQPTVDWDYYDLTALGGNNVVLSVVETSDGVVWFGGNGCMYAFRDGRTAFYPQQELRLPISSLQLLQSRDGSLWHAGVNASVYSIDYSRTKFDGWSGLHYQCTDRQGRRIFLSQEGRVVRVEQNGKEWFSYGVEDGLPDVPTTALVDRRGMLWVAGSHRGVSAVSRLGESRKPDLSPDLSWSISPFSAAVDSAGNVWFGSMGDPSGAFRGGFVVYSPEGDGHRVRRIVLENESFNRINSTAVTADGTIWACGSFLIRYDSSGFRPIMEPKELQRGWFDHLLAASDGSLWTAKGGLGIFRYKDGTWQKFTTENGLANMMVSHLLEVPRGILAATEGGISRFDGESWTTFALPEQITMTRESGSMRRDPDGFIWINLAPRDWYFRTLKRQINLATEHFYCISYRGERQPPKTEFLVTPFRLVMPASPLISWRGIDRWSSTPEKDITFSYRLDGRPWSPFSSVTSIRLNNIDAGRHCFQVRARDRDGNVQIEPAQIEFQIIPPIWRQPWFLALLGTFAAVIFALLGVLSIKNQKLATANREIEKASAFKERFYQNLSHELRTPLTIILAVLGKVDALPSDELKHALAVIRRHTDYLRHLVNQLLEFRRLESGVVRLHAAEGDLVQVLEEVKHLFEWLAQEQHLSLIFVSSEKSMQACFDRGKVETILINLLSNAFKFTPAGGTIRLTLEKKFLPLPSLAQKPHALAEQAAVHGDWAEISITDTGIGIPADRLDHIFERFYTVEHPGGLYYDSIGVGLDLTREIVEMHKGTIQVQSMVGVGTVFTVRLPIDRRAYSAEEVVAPLLASQPHLFPEKVEEIRLERLRLERAKPGGTQKRRDGRSILIVEDHPDLRFLLEELLRPYFQVTTTENGRQAVEEALNTLPDLVISDVMMPEIDGIELTRRLKNHPLTNHIPVILLTVRREIEHRVEGYAIGADAYLCKPFEAEELLAVIGALLENRRKLQDKFRREIVVKPKDVTISPMEGEFLERCMKIVENHLTDPDFHVDQLCREIGMSRTQAYKKIKAVSGFSPNDFIIHMRLKQAAQLLRSSKMNVSEIAYSLGFCDHAHFTRHFHRAFGCSPKEFRKQASDPSESQER